MEYQRLNMVMIKRDINQQYFKSIDLYFFKSEYFSLTLTCESRQRDTTSSGWKFQLNNLAVKWVKLELLMQTPASNDEKYFHLRKIGISQIEVFD